MQLLQDIDPGFAKKDFLICLVPSGEATDFGAREGGERVVEDVVHAAPDLFQDPGSE